jgi:flagellum-specific ATP synthase
MNKAFLRKGKIIESSPFLIKAIGPPETFLGEHCQLIDDKNHCIGEAIVITIKASYTLLFPFNIIAIPKQAYLIGKNSSFSYPCDETVLGRVLNGYGKPLDNQSDHFITQKPFTLKKYTPLSRHPVHHLCLTKIGIIDLLFPIGRGSRMGIFASPGTGKTHLMQSIYRQTEADIYIIALVGERGREVLQWMADIPPHKKNKTVVIVSTSDASSHERKMSGLYAHMLASEFAKNKHVMLLFDSLSRFSMAIRDFDIHLGEPLLQNQITKNSYQMLPEVIEQGGCFETGSLTAIYSVLTEDNQPLNSINEAIQSYLDGHLFLTKRFSEKGQYPAIDILKSLGRLNQDLLTSSHSDLIRTIRLFISEYEKYEDMITLGMIQPGQQPHLDAIIEAYPKLMHCLTTTPYSSLNELVNKVKDALP